VRVGAGDEGQTGELLEPMARVARMIEGHLEGILAHWTRGLTTAVMEGLNSFFSAVKRKARGYWTVEYMTAMICRRKTHPTVRLTQLGGSE
jgi:transposase